MLRVVKNVKVAVSGIPASNKRSVAERAEESRATSFIMSRRTRVPWLVGESSNARSCSRENQIYLAEQVTKKPRLPRDRCALKYRNANAASSVCGKVTRQRETSPDAEGKQHCQTFGFSRTTAIVSGTMRVVW